MRHRHSPAFLLLGAASLTLAGACSASNSGDGDGGADSSLPPFCVDPTMLQAGTANLMLAPETGQLANRQHIVVGSCEAYMLYWAVGPSYDKELITNCAPATLGGSAASQGFPSDCLLEAGGAGGIDNVAITMDCVCCAGGVCGTYCHPVSLGDSGGGLTCASYSYDFQSSLIQDPTTQPDLCDCSGW